ncbi:hypothetical protein Gogos_000567, partial [Gossypium gossypioides]|nr:hypothetical protein [Gossypium gossypioides]
SEGLLLILRWTSIIKTQDKKTLTKIQNSTGRTGNSTDTTLASTNTTWTSIGIMHSSKQGSFGLRLLLIPWFVLLIQPKCYIYLEDFYRNKSSQ